MVIDDKLYRILTKEGFEAEFWNDLKTCRATEQDCTRRAVYERLEELYEDEFKTRQFPSYEAFNKRLSRKINKAYHSINNK